LERERRALFRTESWWSQHCCAVHVAVDDAEATWQRALAAGTTQFEPLHDAFWGDRTAQFIDPFGHRWAVDQHLLDVPHDEVVRRAAVAFGST
jgi:PhnB protein